MMGYDKRVAWYSKSVRVTLTVKNKNEDGSQPAKLISSEEDFQSPVMAMGV